MDYLQYSFIRSSQKICCLVLNLIINGLPSILKGYIQANPETTVLNLIINGLPSIYVEEIKDGN